MKQNIAPNMAAAHIVQLLVHQGVAGAQRQIKEFFSEDDPEKQERDFMAFDEALHYMMYKPRPQLCPDLSAALRAILQDPAEFCTSRIAKRLFRRLADHARMCFTCGGPLAAVAHRVAFNHGCYNDAPPVYDFLTQAIQRGQWAA